jgi:hypothetical protein
VKRFVFLEFTNPKVRKFLTELRTTLEGFDRGSPAHITIRGPYEESPDRDVLEELDERLRGHGVIIGGAGTFENKKSFTVYLKVQSPIFDELWWKPEYPSQEFGIKPHVTIFETKLSRVAKSVETFLRSERIEIFTLGLQLAVYTAKQLNLFESNLDTSLQRKLSDWERWRVRPGLLQRAQRLKESLVT